MSVRSSIWGSCRALAIRARPVAPRSHFALAASRRCYADDANIKGSNAPPPPDTKSNAREVAAADRKGNLAPQEQSGVPGATVAAEQEYGAPADALGDEAIAEILYGTRQPPSDSDPALTPAQEQSLFHDGTIPPPEAAEEKYGEEVDVPAASPETLPSTDAAPSQPSAFKFPPPAPLVGQGHHLKKRYHPVLEQITRLLMRDGKLSVAQRNMTMVMNVLRTAPEPIYSPKFPLLPGTPPAAHLPLNPILYLTIAIDSVAPLIRIRNIAGGAGGGRSLEVPTPLAVRQRRRIAFQWILDAVDKKPSKGSGRKQFPTRLAEEIIAVVEGRSAVWEKRKQVHKLGTAARSNVSAPLRGKTMRKG